MNHSTHDHRSFCNYVEFRNRLIRFPDASNHTEEPRTKMDIDTDREYRIQQLEEFILNHESELSVDGLLVSDSCGSFCSLPVRKLNKILNSTH